MFVEYFTHICYQHGCCKYRIVQICYSERWGVEEALRHKWIKTASELNCGTALDIGPVKSYISTEKQSRGTKQEEVGITTRTHVGYFT